MNLEQQQAQVAEQQAKLEEINAARRKVAEAERAVADARRDLDTTANELRRLETENPPLHVLNQHAGLGHRSAPSNAGVEIDPQSAAAVNVNASKNALAHG